MYVINAWGASDTTGFIGDRAFGTEVEFVYTNPPADAKAVFKTNFGAATSQWQYLNDVVVAQADYSAIYVRYSYTYNENTAYFDGLSFYKEEFGQSYTYDEDGNIKTSKDAAAQSSSFEFANNDMTKLTDAKGNKFEYEYDEHHNIIRAVSAENSKYTFEYDDYGNALESRVVNH